MRTRDRTHARLSRRNAFRPLLEALECRLAPAVIVWDGEAGDNDWNNPVNWFNQTTSVNDVLPVSGDDAQIGAAFAGITITSAANVTINSVTSGAGLTLSAGTFTIAADSEINNTLTLSGGTFTGEGNLTADTFDWTSGAMSGTGPTTVQTALNISGSANKTFSGNRTLRNEGAGIWTGTGNIARSGNFNEGTLHNAAGATFDIATDADFTPFNFSSIALVNDGTITKTAGAGTTSLDARLTNTGTIRVEAGTLRFARNGSSAGTIGAAAGTVVEFVGAGVYTISAGSSVTGAGTIRLLSLGGNNPTVTVGGSYDPAVTEVAAGTLTLDANATSPAVSHSGGSIGGTGTFTVTDYTWTGGFQGAGSGTTVVTGTLMIDGAATKAFNGDRTLRNEGAGTWTGTGNIARSGDANEGTLHNAAGATFQIATDAGITIFNSSTIALINDGTITKTAGAGTTSLDARLTNTGTISVEAGTLRFARTTATSGLVSVAAGATVQVSTTDYLQTAGTTMLEAASATFLLDSGRTLALQGGLLAGAGTITGSVNNTGGILSPGTSAGTLTITGNCTQSSGGTLLIEIGGLAAGTEFDQLVVSGTASLGGTLRVDLIDGYLPQLGDSFLVLDGDTNGSFGSLQLPALADDLLWNVEPGSVILSVIDQSPTSTDLGVSQFTGTPSVTAGSTVTYAITVSNLGEIEAVDVALTDLLPAETTFVSFTSPPGWDVQTPAPGTHGTVTASIASLAAGATSQFELVVRIQDATPAGTVVTNTAQIATATSDDNAGNNTDSADTTVNQPSVQPLMVESVVVNDGAAQRSNIEQVSIRFNQAANLQTLIDSGAIVNAVKVLRSSKRLALDASRYEYDPASFVLTIDLTGDGFGGSPATRLKNGNHQLRLDTTQITAVDSPISTLLDDDGKANGVWKSRFHRRLGDFDGNGLLNRADLDLLFAHLGSSEGDERYAYFFDLKQDGQLNQGDIKAWKLIKGQDQGIVSPG